MEISDELIREIAEYIVIGETEDIEYLTVWEITEDRLNDEDFVLSLADRENIVHKVDSLVRKAKVTVTFDE